MILIGKTNTNIEITGVVDKGHKNINSFNANDSTSENGSQVFMQKLEKNIFNKLGSGVENVVTTVEIWVHEAILSALVNLVVPGMKVAMRLVGISLTRNPSGVVLDPDQRDFSGHNKWPTIDRVEQI